MMYSQSPHTGRPIHTNPLIPDNCFVRYRSHVSYTGHVSHTGSPHTGQFVRYGKPVSFRLFLS